MIKPLIKLPHMNTLFFWSHSVSLCFALVMTAKCCSVVAALCYEWIWNEWIRKWGWVWGLVVAVWSCYQVAADDWAHCRQQWQTGPAPCWSGSNNHYRVTAGFIASLHCGCTLRDSDTAASVDRYTQVVSAVGSAGEQEEQKPFSPFEDTIRPPTQPTPLSVHTFTTVSPDPLCNLPGGFMVAVSKHAIHMINVGNLCPFWMLSISSCCIGFLLPVWYAAQWC